MQSQFFNVLRAKYHVMTIKNQYLSLSILFFSFRYVLYQSLHICVMGNKNISLVSFNRILRGSTLSGSRDQR